MVGVMAEKKADWMAEGMAVTKVAS